VDIYFTLLRGLAHLKIMSNPEGGSVYRTTFIILCIFLLGSLASGQVAPKNAESFIDTTPGDMLLRAPIERNLTYQGILKDGDGNPVADGSYSITFRIYNRPDGGVALWTSSSVILLTVDGLFNANLGTVSLPFDTTYYMSLQVLGDTEMPQRQRLALAPYAASADTALYSFNANRAFTTQRADTSTFSYLSGTASFALNAARADTARFAYRADSVNYAIESGHSLASDYATDAGNSDTSSYSNISGFAIHSDTAVYAWISLGYSHWSGLDSVLYTNGYWGISKGGSGNRLLGDSSQTMVNMGVACTTGTSGQNYYFSTISGGYANRARRNFITIGGGTANNAVNEKSTISGGAANYVAGDAGFIGGGEYNDALGTYSVIAGGYDNQVRDIYGFVGGGQWNNASEDYTTIAGGYSNSATGPGATSLGGFDNHVSGVNGTISGGINNSVTAISGAISGGDGNKVGADFGHVGGGYSDTSQGIYASIIGGHNNNAGDDAADTAATVGGGYNNNVTGKFGFIGGGSTNLASGSWSMISGGWGNGATGIESVIGGGNQNSASGPTCTIAGGQANTATQEFTAIGGGANNSATASGSTVGGGAFNSVSNANSTVSGGYNNIAGGWRSAIGGGSYNQATGQTSTVSGGENNTASGSRAAVGGGFYHMVAGDYSVIPGGYADTATSAATYSLVFGRSVYVNTTSRVVFFDGAAPGRLGLNRDDRDGGIGYPLHIGTITTNGNGAYLTSGGVWTNGSSRTFKENFQPLDSGELLAKISNLSITSWNYKNTTEKHIGPVAEDFVGAFDVGVIRETDSQRDNQYLSSSDVAGVALAGVQELLKKIEALEKKNAELEKRIGELEIGR
jgi:hypothetical protein